MLNFLGMRFDHVPPNVPHQPRRATIIAAEQQPPPPVSLTRKGILRLALVPGYAGLLLAISKAEEDPAYRSRVVRTIASAVAAPNLRVLEIGIGRAANLDLYPRGTELVGLDAAIPAATQRAGIEARARTLGLGSLRWVEGDASVLPFEAGEFDAVVATKVFCSLTEPTAALREVSRVLAPGGRFGFVEHVAADRGSFLEAQQILLDPLQQVLAGNCHLHRDTDALIVGSTQRGGGAAAPALFARQLVPIERYQAWRMWPIVQQAAGVMVK